MKFVERTTAPSNDNKFYIKAGKGGYNRAMEINSKTHSCLPNCVGMAHGRWLESQNQTDYKKYDKLPTGNAENYYTYKKDGYKRGTTPKLGAIICWRKGKAGVASDGAGHVAFVEKVYDNGDVLTSNSAYGGRRYYTKKYVKAKKYYLGSKYTFQGFIYNPCDFTEQYNLTRTLSKGCKGNDVGELQKELNARGYSCGKVDKNFGAKTGDALAKFQKANKLVADKKCGKNTAHKLGWLYKGK
jgi:hypothetical protein